LLRGDRLTEKELSQYKALRARVKRNETKFEDINDKAVQIVDGKVKGSSKYFPYIETHYHVQMYEPKEMDEQRKRIKELEKCIQEDTNRIQLIEKFINDIDEPELQAIFEMRVYERMGWIEIAAEFDEDKSRTTYSRKFKKYLENAHNAPIAQKTIV
jgi:hypothetical protein